MKKSRFLCFYLICSVIILTLDAPCAEVPCGEIPGGEEILAKIKVKAAAIYAKYIGVKCRREITSKQYDDRDGKFLGGYKVIVNRREYYYKKPEYTVVKFIKNDKEESPDDYSYSPRDPVYPPLAPKYDKEYAITLTGKKLISSVPCYQLEVVPRRKTQRHFLGKLYFTENGLDLYYMEGTVARYPLGLKSLYFQLYFRKLGDAFVMSHGDYVFVINIPLFYPHRKFVQHVVSWDDALIPAE